MAALAGAALLNPQFSRAADPAVSLQAAAFLSIPHLDTRLKNPGWLNGAKRIQSGDRTVYYWGSAQAKLEDGSTQWTGTITGDIVVLSPDNATVVPSGTVTLHPGARISVNGPHRTQGVPGKDPVSGAPARVPWADYLGR